MSKEDLIDDIVATKKISKEAADDMIKTVISSIGNVLQSKGMVRIVGFGSFEKMYRAEHVGRNPQTGEAITVPPMYAVRFKLGKLLKERIN